MITGAAGTLSKHLFGESKYGTMAANGALDFMGVGDYKANSLIRRGGNLPSVRAPSRHSSGNDRFTGTDYMDILESDSDVAFTSWIINPMNTSVFPLLSSEAQLWETWKMHGLVFTFISQSGMVVSGTDPNLGIVAMAFQTDVHDEIFDTDRDMLNYSDVVVAKTCDTVFLGVECDMRDLPYNWYFNETNDDSSRVANMGRLTFMSAGQPDTGDMIGRLYVSYDVEFETRKIVRGGLSRPLWYRMSLSTTPTGIDPFGTQAQRTVQSNFGGYITDSADGEGDIFNFPDDMAEGTFLLMYSIIGDSTISTTVTYNLSNLTFRDDWFGEAFGSTSAIATGSGATNTLIRCSVATINDFGASVRLITTTLPDNPTHGCFVVMALPYEFTFDEAPLLQNVPLSPRTFRRTISFSKARRIRNEMEEKYEPSAKYYLGQNIYDNIDETDWDSIQTIDDGTGICPITMVEEAVCPNHENHSRFLKHR